jgi:hypothetical protein
LKTNDIDDIHIINSKNDDHIIPPLTSIEEINAINSQNDTHDIPPLPSIEGIYEK